LDEVADGVLSWQAATVVGIDDVRSVCTDLPGVSERESWGRPAWFARRMLARIWDDGILTVKTDERDALAAQDPDTYFWTPHHDRSPLLLLVRMDRIDELTLRELLNEAHRLAS
jgi:hypothetical protein